MLERVKRPDAREIEFKYDALGRRIEKRNENTITRWVWDGNVMLHEQTESHWRAWDNELKKEYVEGCKNPLITWVFEEGTFVPAAKLTGKKRLSIVANYMGTPEAMYREDGEKVWSCELNSYGKIRSYQGEYKTECPFRYQGQYHDGDTGLYYNRFRYYSPDEGMYLSQDPIRLNGGMSLYSYVSNTNRWVDRFGLIKTGETPIQKNEVTTFGEFRRKSVPGDNLEGHELLQHSVLQNEGLVDGARLSSDASKNNPVIALDAETHAKVSAAQMEAGTQNMKPIESIEANARILREVGIDAATVSDIETKSKEHYASLCD